jgi:alpha-amylase
MWSSGYQKTPMYNFIGLLNFARKVCWHAGFGTNLTIPLHTDNHIAVTQKGPLLMVLSNQGSNSQPTKISFGTYFPPGTVLVDILTSQSLTVRTSTTVTIIEGNPQVYVPYAIAAKIVQNIIPPPMSPIDKIFSFFRSGSTAWRDEGGEITSWSTGAHVNQREILKPALIDVSSGSVLQPAPESFGSPYSIFAPNLGGRPRSTSGRPFVNTNVPGGQQQQQQYWPAQGRGYPPTQR